MGSRRLSVITFPNILSVSRILLAPTLPISILSDHNWIAFGTVAYCAATDAIDGYIARRWKQESALGSVLDPIGDKLLIGSLAGTFLYTGTIPTSLALLILGRDSGLLLSGLYIRYKSLPKPRLLSQLFDPSVATTEVKPTMISKVNTVLQLGLLTGTLLAPNVGLPLIVLQWTVAFTTAWSGLAYFKDHRKVIKRLDS